MDNPRTDEEGEPDRDAPPEGIEEEGSDDRMDPDVLSRIRGASALEPDNPT